MAAKGAVAPHLAAQLAGRVLQSRPRSTTAGTGNREPGWNTDYVHKGQDGNRELGPGTWKANDRNGGNRQPATGNRGGIRITVIKAKAATGTGDLESQRPKRREPATGNGRGRLGFSFRPKGATVL